ncbi:cytochrome c oxidase subunit 3 [Flammeovirgaceae bacterium SG7u.111]|nr:cytochrome c oxidase subunit 3 [Flammeovirgaceae bacterium SG7u.132]WPO33796.1 cytochrome c oxidase subunit 3 [Flammeovirgaceae bacterium SG7u.111]
MSNKSIEINDSSTQLSMNPKKFAMWLFIVSVVMVFAALTSAYIVRQAEGNWYVFDLPSVFYTSSAVILLSSLTMHWGVLSAKKDNFKSLSIAMAITGVLGVVFLVLQVIGWSDLVDISVHFVGNPSGSFLYVITGLHGVHVISAVIFLLVVMVNALRQKIHAKKMSQLEICATYWHFLDGLWIYLFIFLLINR